MRKRFSLLTALVSATLVLAGCTDPNTTPDPVNAVAPVIETQPVKTAAVYTLNDTPTPLTVVASVSDGGTLSYQWFSNTLPANIDGTNAGTGDSYTPSTKTDGTFYYYVVVTNTNDAATGATTAKTVSDFATVIVNNPENAAFPVITQQPAGAIYLKDDTASALTVTASVSDGGVLSYQWFRNKENSATAGTSVGTGDSYTPSTSELGTFYYYVEVSNTNAIAAEQKTVKTTSATAAITVGVRPTNIQDGDTFLLYGIDVITSGYINRGEIKVTRPILDLAKLNAAALITRVASTESIWSITTGSSVSELIETLNVNANVAYKGVVFGGKVETEFKVNNETKQTSYFSKGRGIHRTRDERLSDAAPSVLKNVLHSTFLSEIASKSAAELLDAYGTHLIAQCYWGGEAEFNYSYWGSDLKSAEDVRVAVNASYGKFSADASVENKNKASLLASGADFTSSSRGGNNTTFTSAEAFDTGYEAWVTSIETKPDICAVPDCSESTLIPIWNIIAEVDAAKATAVKAEFDARVSVRGTALAGFVYVPPVENPTYVTDITAVLSPNTSYAPAGFPHWVRNNMYTPDTGDILDTNERSNDSNADRLGIAYKTVSLANNHDAIAEIAVTTGNPSASGSWTRVSTPVYQGVRIGTLWGSEPTYLWYRKVTASDTTAIDFIGGSRSTSSGSSSLPAGYFWVNNNGSSSGSAFDLNDSLTPFIYLTVHKVPFTW